ncbi:MULTISPECIES: DUF4199 domain-containing protein [unclassified Bizionia]|uniref:DUF4199 domain-containing protein n=1 Tax=unclassified Bizionia TaxID=2626393 RepID=UPI0020558CE7|nr:DUF4199 domain-containing protein [Bizionia sp. M204]UPS91485.1 DUF4199 family protein [Bizionia sp. M204]
METSTKSIAINFGLYLGGILSLLTVMAYAISLDLFTKWWFGIAMMILVIVLGVMSSTKSRGALNGFISFKGAFTSFFITVLIGLVISTVVSYVIFNIVDPEASGILQEKILASQVEMMRGFGAPEESIAQIVEEMEKQEDMYSLGNILQALAFQLVGFSVVGLIVALVVKKEDIQA